MQIRGAIAYLVPGLVGLALGIFSTAYRGRETVAKRAEAATAPSPHKPAASAPTTEDGGGRSDATDWYAKHAAEPADPSWSSWASPRLRQDLESAFPKPAVVGAVDCRKTLCLSTVKFPSTSQGQPNWESLLTRHLSVNCGRLVKFDDSDGSEPKTLHVIFDCSYIRSHAEEDLRSPPDGGPVP